MAEIHLNQDQYLELEKIALGAFRPLLGFMNEEEFRSVTNEMRLPDGTVFPLPVVLGLTAEMSRSLRGAGRIIFVFQGQEVGEMKPESWYSVDKVETAQKIFGTADIAHPGVAHLFEMGEVFVGGPVQLQKRVRFPFSDFELSPEETKAWFRTRAWKRIAGFQTRNVPHRAHEYLQRIALEIVDGLFIQPLIGRRKVGDYTPESIIAGYRTLIDKFFPADRVVLGILSTAMRYAGPREAVFHAIIRRNYGCTHFIVGRDHAGVGDYYGKYDAHELTRRFDGELGIEILRFNGPYYCNLCQGIVTESTCPHAQSAPEQTLPISGTKIREILSKDGTTDPRMMRSEIVDVLAGLPLFIEDTG